MLLTWVLLLMLAPSRQLSLPVRVALVDRSIDGVFYNYCLVRESDKVTRGGDDDDIALRARSSDSDDNSSSVAGSTSMSIKEIESCEEGGSADLKVPIERLSSVPEDSTTLAYTSGYKVPFSSVLHMENMVVMRTALKTAKRDGWDGECLCERMGRDGLYWGLKSGCKTVRILAIDDEEEQHRKLVRYWKFKGFKEIKYVGDDVADIPDRIVWGGRGMLMEATIQRLLDVNDPFF